MYRGTEIPCTELAAGSTPAFSTRKMAERRMHKVIYFDVDDTLIRTFGSKTLPIIHVIELVKQLKDTGAELYCWSAAGRDHALEVATEYGIHDCFIAFMTKPDLMIDDRTLEQLHIQELHPNECHLTAQELLAKIKD